jgi:probable rRNA maturation factor
MSVAVRVDRSVRASIDGDARRLLARVARRAAHRLGFSAAEIAGLGLRIVDDAVITELCRDHLGDAHVTDVLSFPGIELPGAVADRPRRSSSTPLAGDIAIDWEQVQRQAPGGRLGWLHEAAQLLVHGLAHLAGHDHDEPRAAQRMLAAERTAARAAGIAPPRRPYGGTRWNR